MHFTFLLNEVHFVDYACHVNLIISYMLSLL
jgi:hypothetical protein